MRQGILNLVPLGVVIADAIETSRGLQDRLQDVRLDAEYVGHEVNPCRDVQCEKVERETEARRAYFPPSPWDVP